MRIPCLRIIAPVLLLSLPVLAVAQPTDLPNYSELALRHSNIEATAVTGSAPVFERPSPSSEFIEYLANGDSVLVHQVAQLEDGPHPMYGIATLESGLVGYIHPHYVPDEIQSRLKDREVEVYPPGAEFSALAGDFPRKSPGLATVYSGFFPGGGHLYAGETRMGLLLLLTSAGSLGLGVGLASTHERGDCTGFDCANQPKYAFLMVGSIYTLVAWIYGISDAGNAARRQNVLHRFAEFEAGPVNFDPTVAMHGDEEAYGISATVRF